MGAIALNRRHTASGSMFATQQYHETNPITPTVMLSGTDPAKYGGAQRGGAHGLPPPVLRSARCALLTISGGRPYGTSAPPAVLRGRSPFISLPEALHTKRFGGLSCLWGQAYPSSRRQDRPRDSATRSVSLILSTRWRHRPRFQWFNPVAQASSLARTATLSSLRSSGGKAAIMPHRSGARLVSRHLPTGNTACPGWRSPPRSSRAPGNHTARFARPARGPRTAPSGPRSARRSTARRNGSRTPGPP